MERDTKVVSMTVAVEAVEDLLNAELAGPTATKPSRATTARNGCMSSEKSKKMKKRQRGFAVTRR